MTAPERPNPTGFPRRRARARLGVAILAFVGSVASLQGLVGPRNLRAAWGYCRTTTEKINDPSYDAASNGCWTKGLPLWWRNACVSYSIQRDASRQVAYDDVTNVIARSFNKWTGATCVEGQSGNSRASIDVRDLGPSNCGNVYHNSTVPNQNVVVFRDQVWPHNDKDNTLALTTVSFVRETGELLGADVEVNTAEKRMSIAENLSAGAYDLESVMTHEMGHFLGMAHSDDIEATMFARYDSGSSVIRTLAPDDVAGICAAYGPDGTRAVGKDVDPSGVVAAAACNPNPPGGYTTECVTPGQGGGCALGPKVAAAPAATALCATFLLGWAALGRRVRRARRHGATLRRL